MKNFLKTILVWLESFNRARVASELSRAGYYKEARALMLDKP